MTLEEFYMISQVVAAFAVVGSLIFVGLQMRQADTTQQALMHQTRTQRQMDVVMGLMEPHNLEAIAKGRMEARDLTGAERIHLQLMQRSALVSTEDALWQHQRGLLEDNVLEDQRRTLALMMISPAHRAIWKRGRNAYGPDLAAYIDDIVSETSLPNSAEREDAQWIETLDLVDKEAAA